MKKILVIDNTTEKMYKSINTLKAKYKVDIAGGTQQVKQYYDNPYFDHLHYFDIIILESFLPRDGMFTLEETDHGIYTGWCLCKKFLKDYKKPIVIWTQYTIDEYKNKKWEANVCFHQKNEKDDTSLLTIIDEIIG